MFIEDLDFDVLCLQEVTEEMLTKFKEMPFEIVYHIDRFAHVVTLRRKEYIEVNYAVILSRHPILSHTKIQFPKLLRTFTSRTFEYFMSRIEKWESISNLGAVCADIKINGIVIQVFSVHLALWNPQTRSDEFAELMKSTSTDSPTIVAGDLNILEYGPIKILNWILGGSLGEGTPWHSERDLMETEFKKYRLSNPLLGKITHKFSASQLDHILVTSELNVKSAWVVPNSHGSDHQPIGVEVELSSTE